jgi:hypothetical protein
LQSVPLQQKSVGLSYKKGTKLKSNLRSRELDSLKS